MLRECGDADRQAIAHYETGHAVVARYYLGGPVAVASVIPSAG